LENNNLGAVQLEPVQTEITQNIENDDIEADKKVIIDGKEWNTKEDQELLKLASLCRCDWKKISKKFDKRYTPYFLKMRYKELTQNRVHRKTKFTHKEDLVITKYFNSFGTDWKRIATFLKDRTGVMVKNRYYSFIRKKDQLKVLTDEVKSVEQTKNMKVDDIESDYNDGSASQSDDYNFEDDMQFFDETSDKGTSVTKQMTQ